MSKESIAANLKKYRKSANISADEVAKRVGKSAKTVYAWENGHGQPDADTLLLLCDLYGIKSFGVFVEPDSKLNELEENIISMFRTLSAPNQQKFVELLEMFAQAEQQKK